MGVHGLWRLLDATGKPVPLETLEGKVLAVDVSIWIHQVLQGYQDRRGNAIPNAHLLGLFNRICKLLYYKIKPVFVFDGGVPALKKSTIASRRKQKATAASKAQKMKNDLLNNLLKHTAVKGALGKENTEEENGPSQTSRSTDRTSSSDMFKLPMIPSNGKDQSESDEDDWSSETDSSDQLSPRKQTRWIGNIHNVDVSSNEFKSLPADVRHDILTDLKETRKQSSWGRLHEMPEESNDFSSYQMKRLLKRRHVQESLEVAEKEMGGKTMTLEELDTLLTEQGISTTTRDDSFRIASNNSTRLIYINGAKNSQEKNTKENTLDDAVTKLKTITEETDDVAVTKNIDEDEREMKWENDWESDWESDWDSDDAEEDPTERPKKFFGGWTDVNPAMMYMLEHSGLSQHQILSIIKQNKNRTEELSKQNSKKPKGSDKKKEHASLEQQDLAEAGSSRQGTIEETIDSNNTSEIVSLHSDSESDDFVEVESKSNLKENVIASNQIVEKNRRLIKDQVVPKNLVDSKKEAVVETLMSDSDSDNFIEVEEVPIPDATFLTTIKKPALEITVEPKVELEEDLFADVFTNHGSSVNNSESLKTEEIKIINKHNVGLETKNLEVKSDLEMKNVSSNKVSHNVVEGSKDSVETKNHMDKDSVMNVQAASDIDSIKNIQRDISVTADKIEEKHASISPVQKDELLPMKIQQHAAVSSDKTKKKDALILPVEKEQLLSMQMLLENEQRELTGNIGRLERQATDITDQMRLEAQELLRLFGIPYLVAPMEAEAQCAYLETINLTDGTITDDSDVWLFGGQCVYKNFFNHNKHVLQFRSCDIQHHFKLTREQMVQLALLVGSDYTAGVTGIGPVTALEILASFPSDGTNLLRGLINFRGWITSGRMAGPGKATLRTKLKNIRIEKGFPSDAVVQAYLTPTVDESKEGFTWNKPNMVLLGDYTREKFGWSRIKFEETLGPVMKKQEEPRKQKGIDSYFKIKTTLKSIEGNLSKRVQKAVQRLGFEEPEDLLEERTQDTEEKKKSKSNASERKPRKRKGTQEKLDPKINANGEEMPSTSNEKNVQEYIPQREKDKAQALKTKLRAIEVFRKSKKGPGKTKKAKRTACKIKEEADLSESSSSS